MVAVIKQREPPPGYPTGGKAKEEEAPQVVDDNNEKAEQNDEDDGETDRGLSSGFIIGRRKPRLPARGYSRPVIYDQSSSPSKQTQYYYGSNIHIYLGLIGLVSNHTNHFCWSLASDHGCHGYENHGQCYGYQSNNQIFVQGKAA